LAPEYVDSSPPFSDLLSSNAHPPAARLPLQASGDPIACFDELSSPRYLPPPYQTRQYDPHSPTLVYVLLHDWCLGAAQGVDPDRLLSQVDKLLLSLLWFSPLDRAAAGTKRTRALERVLVRERCVFYDRND